MEKFFLSLLIKKNITRVSIYEDLLNRTCHDFHDYQRRERHSRLHHVTAIEIYHRGGV